MYRLKYERFQHPKGTVVYPFKKYDYGQASEDTRYFGIPHISVTVNEDGDYPYFTIEEHNLEVINEQEV